MVATYRVSSSNKFRGFTFREKNTFLMVLDILSAWRQLPALRENRNFHTLIIRTCTVGQTQPKCRKTSPSTHYTSFRRRVFPVNHLHWYWQPNKNNQETEHINQSSVIFYLPKQNLNTLVNASIQKWRVARKAMELILQVGTQTDQNATKHIAVHSDVLQRHS